jgi:hypothetical protein
LLVRGKPDRIKSVLSVAKNGFGSWHAKKARGAEAEDKPRPIHRQVRVP